MHSGVGNLPWAFVDKSPKIYAERLCKILGRELKDPVEIIDFLRAANFNKLIEAQEKMLLQDVSIKSFTFRREDFFRNLKKRYHLKSLLLKECYSTY